MIVSQCHVEVTRNSFFSNTHLYTLLTRGIRPYAPCHDYQIRANYNDERVNPYLQPLASMVCLSVIHGRTHLGTEVRAVSGYVRRHWCFLEMLAMAMVVFGMLAVRFLPSTLYSFRFFIFLHCLRV